MSLDTYLDQDTATSLLFAAPDYYETIEQQAGDVSQCINEKVTADSV